MIRKKTTCFLFFMLVSAGFSCQKASTYETSVEGTVITDSVEQIDVNEPTQQNVSTDIEADLDFITTRALILSVREELLMPSDYLTTVMRVRITRGDTLIFTDADGFESLAGKEITLKYRLVPQGRWLVCMNCTAFDENIKVADITLVTSEVQFKKLRLRKFIEDLYIDAASTFMMENEQGEIEEFLSAKHDMLKDSTKMKQSYANYGFINTFYPELGNRGELEALNR
ncbi:hypothetical protein LVD17_12540 [Fulvivirga ulvae]|uniref:hypothetical protein n=1 Tax=Fulvivirga ulvae TaxID=2904245 RepID=UPI001F22AA89|nr:hypothetical protein [Fulvivirga ulvae]UII34636.1 hypothetical protein LVD17_12540 [Fulvivirga ulvae]